MKLRFFFTVNGYEINKFTQHLMSTPIPNLTHIYISSNYREDKCYPTDQKTCPHIGLSSFELCGKNYLQGKEGFCLKLTLWRRNYFFLILAHPVYKI